jgi:hypothetical protein
VRNSSERRLFSDNYLCRLATTIFAGKLFGLISERCERHSIIITCNQPFQHWDQIFEDKQMAIAAIDRLIHHSVVLEFSAESYRKREEESRLRKEGKKSKKT